jgi:hypothetical protein
MAAAMSQQRVAPLDVTRLELRKGNLRSDADGQETAHTCTAMTLDMEATLSVALSYNVTVNGTLSEDEYHYFQICVVKHQHTHLLTMALATVGKGDADLYASTTYSRPTAVRSTWISAGIGSDVIAIRSDHPDWNRDASVMYIGTRTASRIASLRALCAAACLRCVISTFCDGSELVPAAAALFMSLFLWQLQSGVLGREACHYSLRVSIAEAAPLEYR